MSNSAPRSPLTRDQWQVMIFAGGAWLFDNLDQRIFSQVRIGALSQLMSLPGNDADVQSFAKIVTAVFLIGWGLGGMFFGALGDRFGRARMLRWAVSIYAICSLLTSLSSEAHAFAMLRSLAGFGIGGVFGLAVTLIADRFDGLQRVTMLATLQLLSTLGNIGSALDKMSLDGLASLHWFDSAQVWRFAFISSALPAMILVIMYRKFPESNQWQILKSKGQTPAGVLSAYANLIRTKSEGYRLLIGAGLATAGVVGLWAIGEFAIDLQEAVYTQYYKINNDATLVGHLVASAKSRAYFLQMCGAAVGMLIFTWSANRFGRRISFLVGFFTAMVVTFLVYANLRTPEDSLWMMPLMGAAQMSVFAGFSIYLPELFSESVRGTGVSFCYNLGRFFAAAGSFLSATLATKVFGGLPFPEPLRYSAMAMCAVFLIGLIAAFGAPETKPQAV